MPQTQIKLASSPYQILRASLTPAQTLLKILEKLITQLGWTTQVGIVIDSLEILCLLDKKPEILKLLRTFSLLKDVMCKYFPIEPFIVPLYVHADFNLIKDEKFKL